MKLPERIVTKRLVLRPPGMADALDIFQSYANDPKVTRYMDWKPHKSIKTVKIFLEIAINKRKADSEYSFVIEDRKTGELMGMISARINGCRSDIGYVLGRQYHGKGYATEAARALVSALWRVKSIYRIWATCDIANKASARVLEKAGMRLEGILRKWIIRNVSKKPRDTFCYSMVRK
jgi:[ribosomal protein S5]-alanine N-acetyltransferase